MELEITNDSLSVFKALASSVRVKIIQELSTKDMSVTQLKQKLNLSGPIVLMHLKKLEDAGIIGSRREGHNKVSFLKVENINIHLPRRLFKEFSRYEIELPVGQYTAFSAAPSCGLAGSTGYIGQIDTPAYFMDSQRINAGIVWLAKGFLEYQAPNLLKADQKLEMLVLSVELGSEFPYANNNWPSDITFSINGIDIGTWIAPGDFGDVRGKYTPDWVQDNFNQYGLLKTIRITEAETLLDGQYFSPVTLSDLNTHNDTYVIRFEVKNDAKHQGGLTIFGSGFGNYDQNIRMDLFYS
ncbi:metalloregulator ArsR/SmtB family transcription factor [Sporolactobacillus shoreicorticis]|uniref:ArsR/SmtB family transcription factor n=1 Tax=Sporolactobacillus shoreicorticis TaxID=1923877 RepID=A0ABW5S8U1_9BACL|nr:metalloregulator ArsR/SmtB family transcription factor [Sporolactobacillus shoreicorticis]MCO7126022.1 metalloregulator ArsR/SmtB family transcription factor [Sporolactobacillus shoreicorticis]